MPILTKKSKLDPIAMEAKTGNGAAPPQSSALPDISEMGGFVAAQQATAMYRGKLAEHCAMERRLSGLKDQLKRKSPTFNGLKRGDVVTAQMKSDELENIRKEVNTIQDFGLDALGEECDRALEERQKAAAILNREYAASVNEIFRRQIIVVMRAWFRLSDAMTDLKKIEDHIRVKSLPVGLVDCPYAIGDFKSPHAAGVQFVTRVLNRLDAEPNFPLCAEQLSRLRMREADAARAKRRAEENEIFIKNLDKQGANLF